jgi:hypothetical protein
MQKISSYLYPNRIELLIDLAGFTVEFTSVYQRNVKLYNGIDNTIEFDIKNADQKRIDCLTLSIIELNIMDVSGNALPNSPYIVTPIIDKKGICYTTIPQEDLVDLTPQFLTYSVSAVKDGREVMLYADTKFGAVGTIELIGNAMPTFRDDRVYKTFTGEIDFMGNVIYHTSSIPTTFYEAVPTTQLSFEISITGFIGKIWLEGTTASTISVNSYLHAQKLASQSILLARSTPVVFNNIDVAYFKYFRILYQGNSPINPTGTVDKVIVS